MSNLMCYEILTFQIFYLLTVCLFRSIHLESSNNKLMQRYLYGLHESCAKLRSSVEFITYVSV